MQLLLVSVLEHLTQVLQCKPARRVGMPSRSDLFGMTEELR